MNKDEALKLALEALEVANSCVDGYYIPKGKTHLPEIELAITAIKEALANEALEKMAENARELGLDYEPEQEPVAWEQFYPEMGKPKLAYLPPTESPDNACYTPPQRTWVGLTGEEKNSFWKADQMTQKEWDKLFADIEAKLKAKNT